MKPEAWRWTTLLLTAATIGAGGGFIVSTLIVAFSGAEPFMVPKGWSYALTGGALLSWLAGERWRAALRREHGGIIDRVNDELARVRARRQR